MLGQDFILNGSAILTHGFSRVVLSLLKLAAANGKHFSVICTGIIMNIRMYVQVECICAEALDLASEFFGGKQIQVV